jgi:DNA-binding NarL/FixJ family response regulator
MGTLRSPPLVIRVLLADDNALVRRGLGSLLAIAGDVEVVAAASNGAEAVELCERHEPDVVLMDLSMPVLDGVGAVRRIRARRPHLRVLMLTISSDVERLADALAAGADECLLKDVEPRRLVDAVRAAA